MIRVNLLPAEKRRPEGGPRGRTALWMLAAGGVVGLGLWIAQMTQEAAKLEQDAANLETRIQTERRLRLAVEEDLVARLGRVRAQAAAIDGVDAARRRRWAERLDELAALLDSESRGVWLTEIRCDSGGAGEVLEIAGRSAARPGREPATVTPLFAAAVEARLVRRDGATGGRDGKFYFDAFDERFAQERREEPDTAEGASDAFRLVLRRGGEERR
jgi:hypothetical protein